MTKLNMPKAGLYLLGLYAASSMTAYDYGPHDYYKMIGVSYNATDKEILNAINKAGEKARTKQQHDLNQKEISPLETTSEKADRRTAVINEYNNRLKELVEVRKTLLDYDARAKYNQGLVEAAIIKIDDYKNKVLDSADISIIARENKFLDDFRSKGFKNPLIDEGINAVAQLAETDPALMKAVQGTAAATAIKTKNILSQPTKGRPTEPINPYLKPKTATPAQPVKNRWFS